MLEYVEYQDESKKLPEIILDSGEIVPLHETVQTVRLLKFKHKEIFFLLLDSKWGQRVFVLGFFVGTNSKNDSRSYSIKVLPHELRDEIKRKLLNELKVIPESRIYFFEE